MSSQFSPVLSTGWQIYHGMVETDKNFTESSFLKIDCLFKKRYFHYNPKISKIKLTLILILFLTFFFWKVQYDGLEDKWIYWDNFLGVSKYKDLSLFFVGNCNHLQYLGDCKLCFTILFQCNQWKWKVQKGK